MVETAGTARVAVIDDHPLFRHGLVVALQREPDLEIIGEAGDAASALELARTTPIDVAVLDVLMPTTSGITLAGLLHELQPRCLVPDMCATPGPRSDSLAAPRVGIWRAPLVTRTPRANADDTDARIVSPRADVPRRRYPRT